MYEKIKKRFHYFVNKKEATRLLRSFLKLGRLNFHNDW